eukprot:gene497-530_t
MFGALMDSLGFSEANFVQADLDKAAAALLNSELVAGITELRSNFGGNILLPSDTDPAPYNAVRSSAYNKLFRGYPFVIAQAKSSEDVAKVLEFKKKFADSTPLSVAAGKHSNVAIVDHGIVLDLSLLNDVAVDEANLVVSVGAGASTGKIDEEVAKYGLAVVGAVKPEITFGGWAIHGGFGTFSRLYGFGSDQILEAEVVLASGTVVTATDNNEYADLLFAIRGEGANFGVITKFKVQAFKAPSVVVGGVVAYMAPTTASKTATLIEFDKLAQYPFLVKATNLGGWFRVSNSVQAADYTTVLQKQLASVQVANYNIVSEFYAGNISEPLPETFLTELGDFVNSSTPSELTKTSILIVLLGGKIATGVANSSVPPSARSARYYVTVSVSVKPDLGEAAIAVGKKWVSDVTDQFSPYIKRVHRPHYEAKLPERGLDAEFLAKLRAIKAKYDPSNLFTQNYNITP